MMNARVCVPPAAPAKTPDGVLTVMGKSGKFRAALSGINKTSGTKPKMAYALTHTRFPKSVRNSVVRQMNNTFRDTTSARAAIFGPMLAMVKHYSVNITVVKWFDNALVARFVSFAYGNSITRAEHLALKKLDR